MTVTAEQKIDCRAKVVTPENIAFDYQLAGPFQRIPAFLLDLLIRYAIVIATVIALLLISSVLPVFGFTLVSVGGILLYFAINWFYGVILETRFNGRTFGKMAFRLRVISVDGRPINAVQSGLRNLLRLADMWVLLPMQVFDANSQPAFIIPTFCVALVCMTLTTRFQRIGDLAAGTMVISERQTSRLWRIHPDDVRAYGLSDMIPANFAPSQSLVKTTAVYMASRKRLSPARLDELAGNVAKPLIEEFGLLPDTGPDLLMCALYVRIFLPEKERQEGIDRYRASTRGAPIATAPKLPPSALPPSAQGSQQAQPSGVASAASPQQLTDQATGQDRSLGDLLDDVPTTTPDSAQQNDTTTSLDDDRAGLHGDTSATRAPRQE
ncbi:MAG TPA: RDD family protein [Planctomycetaceae bacterium]|nr:RDD family protein [Planctomycetaceae bacterium]